MADAVIDSNPVLSESDATGLLNDGDIEQLVTLIVDNQRFGIPILQVQDIVEPKNITDIPRAPNFVSGVLNLRGRIVTVIDLSVCLGKREHHQFYEGQLSVTVEFDSDLYTLLIDNIGDVINIRSSYVTKVPKNLDDALRDISSGIIQLDEDLVAILSVPMLFKKLSMLGKASTDEEINLAMDGGWRNGE